LRSGLQADCYQLRVGGIVLDEERDQRRRARVDHSHPRKGGIRSHGIDAQEVVQRKSPEASTLGASIWTLLVQTFFYVSARREPGCSSLGLPAGVNATDVCEYLGEEGALHLVSV
jgi:hypothetical protein